MTGHRTAVVSDQDAVLLRRQFEENRIFRPSQACTLDIQNVDGRLTRPQTVDDACLEILIRQESDGHARFERISRRAACNRANNSGFDWLSGGTVRSNSRSLSARYSRIASSFSR